MDIQSVHKYSLWFSIRYRRSIILNRTDFWRWHTHLCLLSFSWYTHIPASIYAKMGWTERLFAKFKYEKKDLCKQAAGEDPFFVISQEVFLFLDGNLLFVNKIAETYSVYEINQLIFQINMRLLTFPHTKCIGKLFKKWCFIYIWGSKNLKIQFIRYIC